MTEKRPKTVSVWLARSVLSTRALSTESTRTTFSIVATLLGEFFREMAVLIIVFAPLDWIVQGKPLTGRFVLAIIALVTVLLGLGIAAEIKSCTTS